jgi:hypothetical protein
MPKGVYERKTKEPDMSPPEAVKTKLFPVILNKNHCPQGEYEIVGYLKEAVKRKDAAGNWRVIEPEEFIKGEMKPHQSPGVGFGEYTDKATGRRFNPKIWAGTQIAVPVDEAKFLVSKKLAERADDFAA